MLNMDEIKRQRDMYRARVELTRMLTELSDDALEYVWRPIAYAWCYTDGNDPDALSRTEWDRFDLLAAIAHAGPDVIDLTARVYRAANDSAYQA